MINEISLLINWKVNNSVYSFAATSLDQPPSLTHLSTHSSGGLTFHSTVLNYGEDLGVSRFPTWLAAYSPSQASASRAH